MHDLFEGVVPYELKLLIIHVVQEVYYFLNDRIERFDFVHNKPSLMIQTCVGLKIR